MIAGVPTEVRTEGDKNGRLCYADELSEGSVFADMKIKELFCPGAWLAGWLV
jgi:hypothetical protein